MLKIETKLVKVISGGQCGVDQGALAAAREVGLLTGGTAPRGYRTTHGPCHLLRHFGLEEHDSPDYPPRTEENVKNSDATLIIACDLSSAGEVLTMNLCRRHDKPFHVIEVVPQETERQFYAYLDSQVATAAEAFFSEVRPRILNVAGNRDQGDSPAMYLVTQYVIVRLVQELSNLDLVLRDTDL